jgi:PEP-CTERM motif
MKLRSGKRSILFAICVLLLFCSAALADSSVGQRDFSAGWRQSEWNQSFGNHSNNNWYRDGGHRDGRHRRPVAVPEPASMTLAGIGLLGLLGAIRQKARV